MNYFICFYCISIFIMLYILIYTLYNTHINNIISTSKIICNTKEDIDKLISEVKTGDFILFKSRDFQETLYFPYYTHIGIIIFKNNMPFILDTFIFLNEVVLFNLKEYINSYCGEINIFKMNWKERETKILYNINKIFYTYTDIIQIPYKNMKRYNISTIFKQIFNNTSQFNELTCTGLINYIIENKIDNFTLPDTIILQNKEYISSIYYIDNTKINKCNITYNSTIPHPIELYYL